MSGLLFLMHMFTSSILYWFWDYSKEHLMLLQLWLSLKKKNLEELKECITVLLVECQPWFLLGTTTYVGPDSEKHVKYWWGWFVLISIAFDSSWRHSRSWHTPASLSGCISFLGEDTQENIYIFVPWTRFHTFECNILMISASPSLK